MDNCWSLGKFAMAATSPQFSNLLCDRSSTLRFSHADSLGGSDLRRLCASLSSRSAPQRASADPGRVSMRLWDSDSFVSSARSRSSSPTVSMRLLEATTVLSARSPRMGSRLSSAFSLAMSAPRLGAPRTPSRASRRLPLTFNTRRLGRRPVPVTGASSPLRLRSPFGRGFLRWGAPPPPPSGASEAPTPRGASAAPSRSLLARFRFFRLDRRASASTLAPARTTLSLRSSLASDGHARASDASTPLMPRPLRCRAVTPAPSRVTPAGPLSASAASRTGMASLRERARDARGSNGGRARRNARRLVSTNGTPTPLLKRAGALAGFGSDSAARAGVAA